MVWNLVFAPTSPATFRLQIISQNYVVWNRRINKPALKNTKLQIISQNYVVWNPHLWAFSSILLKLQIISQNYVVWNNTHKKAILRCLGLLQIISQNYVVWNTQPTTKLARAIFKLQIISQNYVVWNVAAICAERLAFAVANYITKLRGLKPTEPKSEPIIEPSCELYHKTTWFETNLVLSFLLGRFMLQIISQNYVVWNKPPSSP